MRADPGLDQVQVEPRLFAAPPVLLGPERRERNEQKGLVPEHGPQLPGDLIPVQARHGDVEQHGVRLLGLGRSQGGGTAERYLHLMPVQAQQQGHALHGVRGVVHHQDTDGPAPGRGGQLVPVMP